MNFTPGKSTKRERLSTVDLLVLTSLDQLLFILKILFSFVTKQATLKRRSTVLSLPPYLVFPVYAHILFTCIPLTNCAMNLFTYVIRKLERFSKSGTLNLV